MGDLDDQLQRLADQRAARTPETSATAAMAASSSGRRSTPVWWLAAAAMLAVLAGAGAWLIGDREDAAVDSAVTTTTTPPTTTSSTGNAPTGAVQTLTAPVFGVRLVAPADWAEIEPNQTWGGDSGFVAVDVAAHGTLEESVTAMVEEARDLLGPDPASTDSTVNGQRAITVIGTEVTTSTFGEMRHAMTIVVSPRPIADRDEVWANLVIASDMEHHEQILESIEWIDDASAVQHITLPDYGIEFDIPVGWEQEGERPSWQGESGHVSVAATSSGDVDFVAENSANHQLRPYGENPTIEETTADGQPARIIRESEPAGESVASAELVASPPNRIVIDGDTYGTVNIYAEVDDIDAIAASIRWIATDEPQRVNVYSPDPTIDYDIVVGTGLGVELRHADNHNRVDVIDTLGPVALAFLVDGHLVYQPADSFEELIDGPGTSEIRLGVDGGSHPLDLGDGTLRLLDAAVVDGEAMALVTRRTGQTPESANEDLLLVDLADESFTNLGRVGGWESGLADARFGDGAIALLHSAEGFSWLAAIDYDGTELWAGAEEFDGPQGLAIRSDVVLAVTPQHEPLSLTIEGFHLRTGATSGDTTRTSHGFAAVGNTTINPQFCLRIDASVEIRCGQAGGAPLQFMVDIGTVEYLEGLTLGTPTTVNATGSTTFPALHECGLRNPSYPHEVWPKGTVDANGVQLEIILAVIDDELTIQGSAAGRFTNRLSLGNRAVLTIDRIDDIQLGGLDDTGGLFQLFIEGEGGLTLDFDGCNLSIVNGFDI